MATFTKQQIVEEVLARLNDVKEGKVLREVRPFLGGALYVVGFTDADDGSKRETMSTRRTVAFESIDSRMSCIKA